MIKLEELSTAVGGKTIVQQVTASVNKGEFVGLVGSNGSGKSTLLKTIYRVLKPQAGLITLEGEALSRIPLKETAKKMAVVSQEAPLLFEFKVREIVHMGRFPHKRLLEPDTPADEEMVQQALQQVGLQDKLDEPYSGLSGGEKQRVQIARVLAQGADYLILDEPTNHLDIHHQLHILELVKSLEVTVLAALHDLNLAAMYCDRLLVMKEGNLVADGTPEEVLTPSLLAEIFQVQAEVRPHPVFNKPVITFFPTETRGRNHK
ncbi:heme ABC transporter ATP-binding protein [Caldalkalibacillus thermarum TA2.A1]|uniref:Heme ABC transporter ATP-binding protein n=1 Tax=Caldalkalibacillus thermarum (strain TA2.A1) TaxID=986075 RepID=A0A8X8I8Y1_CALTT|nr:heme ABC transporter ATP-binding protein [Caldalkalibacillus thermarum]QZT33826.1 heme ABC transporter ATP-binding protein [Caldalkalibacillus thermarum TA2.A1]